MLQDSYPYYLANQIRKPNTDLEVIDKYTGEVATRVALADEAAIGEAIARAVEAVRPMQDLPAYGRQNILQHCADRFSERAEELAQTLCIEAGKPINDSRGEVTRLIETFKIAAEESVRLSGTYLPLDRSPRTRDYTAVSRTVVWGARVFGLPWRI